MSKIQKISLFIPSQSYHSFLLLSSPSPSLVLSLSLSPVGMEQRLLAEEIQW
jgi:hypothetical protein